MHKERTKTMEVGLTYCWSGEIEQRQRPIKVQRLYDFPDRIETCSLKVVFLIQLDKVPEYKRDFQRGRQRVLHAVKKTA